MIPIYDDNPTRRIPWVTMALITLNMGVFVFELSLTPGELNALFSEYAFVAAEFFADSSNPRQLMTLVSATFLHAGWVHVLGNMLYLWTFGSNIEDRLGKTRFIAFYASAGAMASLVQAAVAPDSAVPMVGASGAIAGVLGAYLVLYPRARVITLIPIIFYLEVAAVPAGFVIGLWFLVQLAQGVGSIAEATSAAGVAWWAHLGGFVFGLLALTPLAIADQLRKQARKRR